MMTLHWSPRSPYVRKVMIAAHEMGLSDQLNCIRTVVGGTAPHVELMQENPLGKIPTLVLQDGTIFYDSPVVCEYLDSLHSGPKLFPTLGPDRFTALRRQALGSGMIDMGLLLLGERARPEEGRSQPHMDLWTLKLQTSVSALEKEADALAATPFTIGHVAIGVALGYLDFRFDQLQWREGHSRLAAWYVAFRERPSVQANLPAEG